MGKAIKMGKKQLKGKDATKIGMMPRKWG